MGARVPESVEEPSGEGGGVGEGPPLEEAVLRPMEADDLRRVLAIERASFTNPWKTRTFRNLLDRDDAALEVAELEGHGVIGYLVVWFAADEGELADLAVAREYRGRGLGSRLLDRAVEVARENGVRSLFLEVRESNRAAAALYQSRGFRMVTIREDYYREPTEDALVMLKSLW